MPRYKRLPKAPVDPYWAAPLPTNVARILGRSLPCPSDAPSFYLRNFRRCLKLAADFAYRFVTDPTMASKLIVAQINSIRM